MVARQNPDMNDWYDTPPARNWTIDPMMLDAAFQAAILWAWETRKAVCLPSYMANLRLYATYTGRSSRLRILFTVNHETTAGVHGYFTFLDESGQVVASIMGFEAVIDATLIQKFKAPEHFSRKQILAFAQGNPSEAFGEPYKIFDQEREIARLPRPPYFFMDRVLKADHPQWTMEPGGWVQAQYDIPENEWYFAANRTRTLPFCILLEIALQPCGWLAAYAGSALQSQARLHFRNLGGKATLMRNIGNKAGTLTMRCRITDVSKAGGMIIQDFEMEVWNRNSLVYQGTTNFGFFTGHALANQVGIRNSRFAKPVAIRSAQPQIKFPWDAPLTPSDTNTSKNTGMPAKSLLMIDTIDHMELDGGLYGKGWIIAGKTVDPQEWFFDAHFYQDPVCPGSLGVESFIQMLRFFLLEKFTIDPSNVDVVMTPGHAHEWIYRGQIIPKNKQITIQAHIKSCSQEEDSYSVVADGALTVDNICIYEMIDFSISFIPSEFNQSQTLQASATSGS